MPQNVQIAGVALVVALFGVFLAVGYGAARRVRPGAVGDLLVAGRELPLWLATLTMTATWVDGGYLLGSAEGAQTSLALGLQGGICFGLSLVLGGLAFAAGVLASAELSLLDAIGAFAGSYIAGLLFLLAPGGLGVREGVFIWMVQDRIGPANALALAGVSRIGMTLADLLAALPFVARRWNRSGD